MTWAIDNAGLLTELTLRHLWLSLVPIAVGFVLALPLGWWAARSRRAAGVLLGVSSLLYAVPSLPLFLILPSLIGTRILDPVNVVVALSMYALAVMLRSAADGFGSVPPAVVDAATASGHSPWQRALTVELPLTGPVLLAGVRVVAVSTVSLVSVGALVGVRSLGSLFTDGFARGFTTEIVLGVLLTVLLALVLDAVLVLLGRVLLPWTSARSSRRPARVVSTP